MKLNNKLKIYYMTAIVGVVLSVTGFIYNAWTENWNRIDTDMAAIDTVVEKIDEMCGTINTNADFTGITEYRAFRHDHLNK